MNRFDNTTVSAYSPQSFEELAFVPLMKRKKHDEILAQQELVKAGLAKVDPLDVHFEEAQKLKQDLESKIDNTALELSQKGINNDMIGKTIALNREYQNQISPTGRIGRINEAKKIRDAERARFLENASKQYGSTRALELWNEHENNYSGFNDKNDIDFIQSKGIVGAQDFEKDLTQYHSLLGMTERSASSSGYNIKDIPQADGTVLKAMVNSSGQIIHSDNIDQINEMRKTLSSKWIDSAGEGAIFNKEAGIDLNNFNSRFNSAIDMQKKQSDVSKTDINANIIRDGGAEKTSQPTTEGVVYDTKEVGTDVAEYDELDNIGKPVGAKIKTVEGKNFSPVDVNSGEVATTIESGRKNFSHEDIKNPFIKARYKEIYNGLIERGVLKKEDRNPDKTATAKLIKNIMKQQGPITLSSKVIKSDMELNSLGFPGQLVNKDNTQRSSSIEADLKQNVRQIIDPETNREMTWKEFSKKYPDSKIEYYGYSSPHNWDDKKWGNPKQNVAANQVNITYKDGDETKVLNTSVSRTTGSNGELNSKDFQASETLNKTYKKATINPNSFVPLQTSNNRLKGLKVRYNNSQSTIQKYGAPTFDVQIGKEIIQLPENEYLQFIYAEYNK